MSRSYRVYLPRVRASVFSPRLSRSSLTRLQAVEKPDLQILPAVFYSQGRGEMGLAAPAFAQEKDVPASGDVVSGGQFTDESPVELRRLFEGEGRQCFDQWKTGFFQPSLLPVLGADPEFQVRELQEELFVA